MSNIHIGTSGFYYKSWIGNFYPKEIRQKDLLSFYATQFKTVEINSSFYHLPRESTVIGWIEKVPQDFIFSFKLSRFITHIKKLSVDQSSLDLFFDRLSPVEKSKVKNLVLIQIPASIKKDTDKLQSFLKLLPKNYLYTFEARHESWFNEEVYKVLRKYNVALVLSDSPVKFDGSRYWPLYDIDTADFFYIRFHGSKKLFYSSYTDEELSHYAALIKKKAKKSMQVFAYFNNDAGGFATKNALDLIKKIQSS